MAIHSVYRNIFSLEDVLAGHLAEIERITSVCQTINSPLARHLAEVERLTEELRKLRKDLLPA